MAADLTQSFMGKHFEKIVLLAAVVICAVTLVLFVFGRQDQGTLRGQVDRTLIDIKSKAKETDLDKVKALSADERIRLGINQPPRTAEAFKEDLAALGPPWQATPKMAMVLTPTSAGPAPPPAPTAPAVQPVEQVNVVVGRGVTTEAFPTPLAKLDVRTTTSYCDIAWATCVGQVNLTEQLRAYDASNIGWQAIFVSRVDLQRRELKPDGTWAEWKPVAPYVPATLKTKTKMVPMPTNPQDRKAVGEWGAYVYKQQADIRRIPMPVLVAVDPEGKTAQAVVGNITAVEQPSLVRPAAPAPEGEPAAAPTAPAPATAPPTGAGLGGPDWLLQLQPGVTKGAPGPGAVAPPPGAQDVYATVWANDLTVEPGKTYQYQMRVSILSPIYLNARVKDEKTRWALEFTGAWSDAGDAVSIPPLVEFFFIGSSAGKANLEMHRWIHGQWVIVPSAASVLGAPVVYTKSRVQLKVPGNVGQTATKDVELIPNVLLLDVIRGFPYLPAGRNNRITTSLLVYSDAQGKVNQRIEWEDRDKGAKARADRVNVLPVPPVVTPTSTAVVPPPVTPPVRPPVKPKTPTRP